MIGKKYVFGTFEPYQQVRKASEVPAKTSKVHGPCSHKPRLKKGHGGRGWMRLMPPKPIESTKRSKPIDDFLVNQIPWIKFTNKGVLFFHLLDLDSVFHAARMKRWNGTILWIKQSFIIYTTFVHVVHSLWDSRPMHRALQVEVMHRHERIQP